MYLILGTGIRTGSRKMRYTVLGSGHTSVRCMMQKEELRNKSSVPASKCAL
jgi:hypothetical protein